MSGQQVSAELLAVVVAMADGSPTVLTLGEPPRLPAGPLLPSHRSLQAATRAWVEEQTGLRLGFLEQLYTFADLDRDERGGRPISVSYLGLTAAGSPEIGGWTSWYDLFGWEDRRGMASDHVDPVVAALLEWADREPDNRRQRHQRISIDFGLRPHPWRPELVLHRYELLYEAGLVPESPWAEPGLLAPGGRMAGDHRRVLATGIARLRAKIEYRPVVFELMPAEFTLTALQRTVEAISGRHLHKQNFRRLVETTALVEATGETSLATGGRPASLYRFRRDVLRERPAPGLRLGGR